MKNTVISLAAVVLFSTSALANTTTVNANSGQLWLFDQINRTELATELNSNLQQSISNNANMMNESIVIASKRNSLKLFASDLAERVSTARSGE